ncbi:hypothetical protein [Cryptosporangium aurantiacum]|uniref:Uncharacterized protein n=1 Tax=Cryptosporangium aurantiacum TaxID=134849 RepID=A0A1M7R800_9ACTN|nr:hypothetical protein [Cryptosporangium aurantiacum]SHN42393.1 hypothetical protein SAMN05443668_108195 [Cryptosporangium aurantiacum]
MTPVEPLRQLFTSAIALLPEGGQRTARRNAWAAMSEDNRRARDRREAATAFTAVPGVVRQANRGAGHTH